MKVSKIGEFELVEKIKKLIRSKNKNGIIIGPGDDAFVSQMPPGMLLVCTKDLLVEDIHFKTNWSTPFELGYKSMAANISDLAAMGGAKPLYAVIGLVLKKDTDTAFVEGFSKGLKCISDKYGAVIAGGDTVSSKSSVMISITLIGAIKKKIILKRSGAKPGDKVLVTGSFGDSCGGLFLLEKGVRTRNYLLNKHLMPEPRLNEAQKISKLGATSMIDSSDGLAASLNFISIESKAGIKIDVDKIPVSRQLKEVSKKYKSFNLMNAVLSGGEEYELVFTAKQDRAEQIIKAMPNTKIIGEVVKGKGVEYFLNNKKQGFNLTGFQHFK